MRALSRILLPSLAKNIRTVPARQARRSIFTRNRAPPPRASQAAGGASGLGPNTLDFRAIQASLDPANPPPVTSLVAYFEPLSKKTSPQAAVTMVKIFEFVMEFYPDFQFNLIELSQVATAYMTIGGLAERADLVHLIFVAIERSGSSLEWNRLTNAAATLVDKLCVAIQTAGCWEYTEPLMHIVDKMHPSSIMRHAAIIYVVLSRSPPERFESFEQKLMNANVFNEAFFNSLFSFSGNRTKREMWLKHRGSIKNAIMEGTGQNTRNILLEVLEETFRHQHLEVAEDVLNFTREIDYVDGDVLGRIVQIYVHTGFTEKASALYEEMKQKNIQLNEGMFTDCATYIVRTSEFVSKMLAFVDARAEDMKPTAYSIALRTRQLALSGNAEKAIEQFNILLSRLWDPDEYWTDLGTEELNIALASVQEFGELSLGIRQSSVETQRMMQDMLPTLIDAFFQNKFVELPFVFHGGHISLHPRMVNVIILLLEIVGPRASVIAALDVCFLGDKYPALSVQSARMFLTYMSALNFLPSNATETFLSAHRIDGRQSPNFALKGPARRELVEVYRQVSPQLTKLSPDAADVAISLQNYQQ